MDNSKQAILQCSTLDCNRTAKFYCPDHNNNLLCNGCATFLYSRCVVLRLDTPDDLTENIGIIKDKLKEIGEYAKIHSIHNIIDNFDILYNKAKEDIEELNKQATEVIEGEVHWRISELNLEAKKLK